MQPVIHLCAEPGRALFFFFFFFFFACATHAIITTSTLIGETRDGALSNRETAADYNRLLPASRKKNWR